MATNQFGGPWSILKLSMLKDYIQFYTTALTGKFKLIYIDAFAGTGNMASGPEDGALFDSEKLDGSARIALNTSPSFDHHIFIEQSETRLNELKAISSDRKDVEYHQGDSNQILREVIDNIDWRNHRAVLFVDPYGLGVKWEMLEYIAATKAIDLWYLVNTLSMSRQLATDYSKLEGEPYKSAIIDGAWGDRRWRDFLYKEPENPQLTMFDSSTTAKIREGGNKALDDYGKKRLKTIFPLVLGPKPLFDSRGHQLFSLFFCASNPSPKACGLSAKAASYILNKR